MSLPSCNTWRRSLSPLRPSASRLLSPVGVASTSSLPWTSLPPTPSWEVGAEQCDVENRIQGSVALPVLRNTMGGVRFPAKKRYKGVRFNVISITRGWVGVNFPGKKLYITLEWPLIWVLAFSVYVLRP